MNTIALPPEAAASHDEHDALLAEALLVMHDPDRPPPAAWVLGMLTLEAQHAQSAGRLTVFTGRGRWMRLLAPEQRSLLCELTATLVVAGVLRHPLHRGY